MMGTLPLNASTAARRLAMHTPTGGNAMFHCPYPYVAPACTTTLASITPNYHLYQGLYIAFGALLTLFLGTKLVSLRHLDSDGASVQRRILALLICAACTTFVKAVDPNGLNGILPTLVHSLVGDSATSFIFSACTLMVMFWRRLIKGHATWLGPITLVFVWATNVVFPILQTTCRGSYGQWLYMTQLGCTALAMFVIGAMSIVYGIQIQIRLEAIQENLEAGRAPLTDNKSPMTGTLCFRSKIQRAVVGIFMLTTSVLVLQIIMAIFFSRKFDMSNDIRTCLTVGCTEFHMSVPLMSLAQILCIGGGAYIFIF
ncbi:Aste57867_1092 [Aphanomyces stellatus]|uniref:Aste57867_1092 protein n=1 Tax=Aphanomyces stellatus TaxID=120398 RepID=A0A485K5K4_9STRA|nr:hypothetical protein As57867_001091 [Aphanomyces stellatus]VFT78314.1 Aste57867_1092 [Aphanomyces stellatus]